MKRMHDGVMPHLGILLTTACNLNCRKCADMINYRPVRQYDISELKEDLTKVLDSIESMDEILLVGGEITLYSHFADVLRFCLGQEKIKRVIAVTNGVLTPSEEVLSLLENPKATYRVSGYDEHIAPNRKNLIEILAAHNINCENLEGQTWVDIGDNHNRKRSISELEYIFQNCSMAECVSMTPEGKLFWCSREMGAYETDYYPTPNENEYIDVRKSDIRTLREKLGDFYKTKYISTCNYCDGIVNGRENKRVIIAQQRIDKESFLTLIECLMQEPDDGHVNIETFEKTVEIINNHFEEFQAVKGVNGLINMYGVLLLSSVLSKKQNERIRDFWRYLRCITYDLSKDFQYECIDTDRGTSQFVVRREIKNRRNVIRTAVTTAIDDKYIIPEKADIIFDYTDLLKETCSALKYDEFSYQRMYLRSQIEKDEQCPLVIAGLSYNQYGIDLSEFTCDAANLTTGGIDIRYSLELIELFLKTHKNVKMAMIAFAPYDAFYDMESSQRTFHRLIKDRVLYPNLYHEKYEVLSPLFRMFDFNKIANIIEKQNSKSLEQQSFFNDINPYPTTGGLNYDFHKLDEAEKYYNAIKTVRGNEDSCRNYEMYNTILERLLEFCEDMEAKSINVFFYTPPATKYVYEQMNPLIISKSHEMMNYVTSKFENVSYMDLFDSREFHNDDFADFEHMSASGAKKMSNILNNKYKKTYDIQ